MKQKWSNVKGCSNQSRLNKNVSYHRVLGEERKIKFLYKTETTYLAKRFLQNSLISRKYFTAKQYQKFRKFQH